MEDRLERSYDIYISYEAGTVLEAQNLLEIYSRVCQLPTEGERTEAGCYSDHKMRAEPQKGSAPFPASGAPHSPRAQLPWA